MDSKLIAEGLVAVESALTNAVDSDVEALHDASHHIISSGGKRIRPQVALLAYLAAGGDDLETAVPMAAALEMVHTATLVHDDINDHSLTRRGQVTVHAKWGRTFALLTGDYLFTKVYELMAPYGTPYNAIMSDACIRLVEGETLQASAAKVGTMDAETYKTIISRKTASLFEAGAEMGARLAGADDAIVEMFIAYAHNLGLTFQIVDDILDIVGDPETMGKDVGLDLAQHRGVMAARDDDGSAAPITTTESEDVQEMISQLRDSGAVEIARMQAAEVARRARVALEPVTDSPAKQALLALVDLVMDRDK